MSLINIGLCLTLFLKLQGWTSPIGAGDPVPVPVKLQYQGSDIYFAEISKHLLPGGSGLGTFQQNRSSENDGYVDPALSLIPSNSTRIKDLPVGAVVRYVMISLIPDPSKHVKKIFPMGP